MQRAEEAVKGFLSHNNKHSVDIEQTSAPAVTHERIQESKHENVTIAHDREIHQHHHQTHVQPIQDKVIEPEQHHVNVIPVEHRQQHHGKDAEVERVLKEQATQFRDEREVLPSQHSKSSNTIVGEHVHHHIHDTIQPVIERERLQQHVVHTTIPIHERIDKEPVIHSGNVLPTKTLAEFEASGHSLTGHHAKPEHIDYEGEPLKIREDSRVGFDHASRHDGAGSVGAPGELGTRSGHTGAAGITGAGGIGSALHSNKTTDGPHNSNVANKLDPRVDSDRDGKSGLGNTTGSGLTGSSTSGSYGTEGYGNSASTGLGSGRTGLTEGGLGENNTSHTSGMHAPMGSTTGSHTTGSHTTGTTTDSKPSTAEKLMAKVGLK